MTCPQCGIDAYIRMGNCFECQVCGYSLCTFGEIRDEEVIDDTVFFESAEEKRENFERLQIVGNEF